MGWRHYKGVQDVGKVLGRVQGLIPFGAHYKDTAILFAEIV